jgi:hypothetical protein
MRRKPATCIAKQQQKARGKIGSKNRKSFAPNSGLRSAQNGGDLVGYNGMVYNRVERSIMRPLRIERRTELINFGTVVSSNSAVNASGFTFKMSDAPGYASLQTAFDQYRIIGIEFIFKALNTPTAPTTTGQCTSHLLAAVDLDSVAAPTTYGDIGQFDKRSRILLSPGQSGVLAFKPSPIGDVDNTLGAAATLVLKPDAWMDFADPTVKYYGLKYLITQNATTAQTRWELWAEMTYECASQN